MDKMILNTAFLLIFKQRSTAESIYCCQIFRQHFGMPFFTFWTASVLGARWNMRGLLCTPWSLLTSAVRGERQDKRFDFKILIEKWIKSKRETCEPKTNELFTCNFRKCFSKVISFFWSLIKKSEWQDNARNRFHRRDLNASLFLCWTSSIQPSWVLPYVFFKRFFCRELCYFPLCCYWCVKDNNSPFYALVVGLI